MLLKCCNSGRGATLLWVVTGSNSFSVEYFIVGSITLTILTYIYLFLCIILLFTKAVHNDIVYRPGSGIKIKFKKIYLSNNRLFIAYITKYYEKI